MLFGAANSLLEKKVLRALDDKLLLVSQNIAKHFSQVANRAPKSEVVAASPLPMFVHFSQVT